MKQPAVKSHDRVLRAGVLGGEITKAADISQERGGQARKGIPLEPAERVQPGQHLSLSPVTLISDF